MDRKNEIPNMMSTIIMVLISPKYQRNSKRQIKNFKPVRLLA